METKEPLIYAFKTASGNNYVFDVATNHTYFVDEVDITVIENFRKMSLDELKSLLSPKFGMDEIIKSHQKIDSLIMNENAFFPNFSSDNSHKIPSEKEYFLNTANIQQMTLELTQRCNLRCKYCVYGDAYPAYRTHSQKSMPWQVAKNAIDYFVKLVDSNNRTTTLERPAFSFYGGEPLIKFKTIKKSVEYIRKKHRFNDNIFNFTTNATLLNENIVRFLIKNNFSMLISLDGPASEHDKNRVFKNGKPTFDIIWKNIKLIKSIDADFFKTKVGFNAVINPSSNLHNVCSFFRNNTYRSLSLSDVSPINSSFFDSLSVELVADYYKEIGNLYQEYFDRKIFNINNSQHEPLDILFGKSFRKLKERYSTTNANWGPGLCLPGINKIYVSTDGLLHACERVNHHFPVGDCWNGLNYLQLLKLFNKFNEKVNINCNMCLLAHNCPICYANACNEADFNASDICLIAQRTFKNNLIDFYSTLEKDPLAFSNN